MSTIRDAITQQSNEQFVTVLRAILIKLDAIAAQVAVQSGFIEMRADIEGWINVFGGKVNVETTLMLPGNPPVLALAVLALIDLDLSEFIAYDKRLAEPIWGPPHTISYYLGKLEAEGDATAKQMCQVLGDILGSGHCAKAYDNGNGD